MASSSLVWRKPKLADTYFKRMQGTIRDREKVMRGMQKKESPQKIIETMRIYYNYCSYKPFPARYSGKSD
jgi:hypothetical protein